VFLHNSPLKGVATKASDFYGKTVPLTGGDQKGLADANSQAFEEMMGEGAGDGDGVALNGFLVDEEDRHGDVVTEYMEQVKEGEPVALLKKRFHFVKKSVFIFIQGHAAFFGKFG